MKKKLLITLICSLALASCSKDKDAGGISFDVFSDVTLEDVVKSKVSEYATLPGGGDFTIVIKDVGQEKIWEGKVKDWIPATKLTMGTYTVAASYGDITQEGAGKPCYKGNTNFSIEGAATTTVKIPVELENCLVKVVCTDNFKKYFTEGKFTLTTGNGNSFDITKDSDTALFIEAYKFTIAGNFKNQGGVDKTFSNEYQDLSPATLYTVKYDISNVGGLKVTVTFNDTVAEFDLGEVEINN